MRMHLEVGRSPDGTFLWFLAVRGLSHPPRCMARRPSKVKDQHRNDGVSLMQAETVKQSWPLNFVCTRSRPVEARPQRSVSVISTSRVDRYI